MLNKKGNFLTSDVSSKQSDSDASFQLKMINIRKNIGTEGSEKDRKSIQL